MTRISLQNTAAWGTKRVAWTYGCTTAGTAEEQQVKQLLYRRVFDDLIGGDPQQFALLWQDLQSRATQPVASASASAAAARPFHIQQRIQQHQALWDVLAAIDPPSKREAGTQLRTRVFNALVRTGIQTPDDLRILSPERLLRIQNIGRRVVDAMLSNQLIRTTPTADLPAQAVPPPPFVTQPELWTALSVVGGRMQNRVYNLLILGGVYSVAVLHQCNASMLVDRVQLTHAEAQRLIDAGLALEDDAQAIVAEIRSVMGRDVLAAFDLIGACRDAQALQALLDGDLPPKPVIAEAIQRRIAQVKMIQRRASERTLDPSRRDNPIRRPT